MCKLHEVMWHDDNKTKCSMMTHTWSWQDCVCPQVQHDNLHVIRCSSSWTNLIREKLLESITINSKIKTSKSKCKSILFVAQTHFKRSNLLSLNKSMCLFQQHYYFCWCEAFPQFTCWYLYSNNVTAHAQKPWLLLFVTKLSSMTVHTKIRVFTVYLWIYQQTGNSISYFYDILRSVLLDVFNVMNPLSFIVNL